MEALFVVVASTTEVTGAEPVQAFVQAPHLLPAVFEAPRATSENNPHFFFSPPLPPIIYCNRASLQYALASSVLGVLLVPSVPSPSSPNKPSATSATVPTLPSASSPKGLCDAAIFVGVPRLAFGRVLALGFASASAWPLAVRLAMPLAPLWLLLPHRFRSPL